MQKQIREIIDPIKKVDNLILDWHKFPIDYWWRKKHNIPFGSQQHRDMNFIDMLIEYREEFIVNRLVEQYKEEQDKKENLELGLKDGTEVVHLSREQIDDDYESLDLSQFDKD